MAAGGDADNSITFDQLRGIKQPRRVASLLSSLHQAGCDRDKAGNRQLHFDDYVLLILLWLFNPMVDSMRMLLKVSELPELQTRLGIKRCSLGSFSESCRVRDNSVCDVIEDRPLDEQTIASGVISDQIVQMGLSKKPGERADHPTRWICIRCSPHTKRGKGKRHGVGQTGPTSDGVPRIVTDLLTGQKPTKWMVTQMAIAILLNATNAVPNGIGTHLFYIGRHILGCRNVKMS